MHASSTKECSVVTSELLPSEQAAVAAWARQSIDEGVVVTSTLSTHTVLCVASRGLSATCCAARAAGLCVVRAAITELPPEKCTMGWCGDAATRTVEPFVLKQLGGYTVSLTGFAAADGAKEMATRSRDAITQSLEALGAVVLPRLDSTVDILVVPWSVLPPPPSVACPPHPASSATSNAGTAKMRFAIKHNIPIVCADALLQGALSGRTPLETILEEHASTAVVERCASRSSTMSNGVAVPAAGDLKRNVPALPSAPATRLQPPPLLQEAEKDPVGLPSHGEETTSAEPHPCDTQAEDEGTAHDSELDDDMLALCFPIILVCFGVSNEEHVAVRKLIAMLHPFAVAEQPVVTGLTTHVIAGTAVEKLVTIPGNQEILEQFTMQFQRLAPSRIKTVGWLQALCGVSLNDKIAAEEDEDPFLVEAASGTELAKRLRAHFDGHCLLQQRGGLLRPRMELDGFLEPTVAPQRVEQRSQPTVPLRDKPNNAGALPAASLPKVALAAKRAAVDSPECNKDGAKTRNVDPERIVPQTLLRELIDLLRAVWPSWDLLHQASIEGLASTDACFAALLARFEEAKLTTLFEDVTFLCEDIDHSRRRGGSSDKNVVSNEECIFSLHRLAALRLILKSCGGSLIRKTKGEIAEMMSQKHELLRPKRTSSGDGPRVYPCLALVPHAFESCHTPPGSGRRTMMAHTSAGHTLRSSNTTAQRDAAAAGKGNSGTMLESLMDIPIPHVTSTWVLACVHSGLRLAATCTSKRAARSRWHRGLPSTDARSKGMQFLRQLPSRVHPYADIITSVSAKNLETNLPHPPSPFLTTLRYVKHQLRADAAATGGGDPPAEGDEVGQGVRIMCVGHNYGACVVDAAHLAVVCKALGGQLERVDSGTEDGVPLHRVTHVVTDCTLYRPPQDPGVGVTGEGGQPDGDAGRYELDTSTHDDGPKDDVNAYLLHCVAMLSIARPDIVLVDASWLSTSVLVGYFVDEAAYRVYPPPLRNEKVPLTSVCTECLPPDLDVPPVGQRTVNDEVPERSQDADATTTPVRLDDPLRDGDAFDLLPDALTSAVRSMETSVGEGNGRSRGRLTRGLTSTMKTPLPTSSDVRMKREDIALMHADTDAAVRQGAYESPTAVHPVGPPAVTERLAAVCDGGTAETSRIVPRGARVYVLSSVPKLAEIKAAIASTLSEPMQLIPSASNSSVACASRPVAGTAAALQSPWTHLVWATTSADADIVVSNEITQRESVLFAMAAGLWLVTDAFIWDSVKEMRVCDIAPYEWCVARLPPADARKRACVALAQHVAWWRRLRQRQPAVVPFGGPCIRHIVLVSSPLSGVLGSILEVGGGRVTTLGALDGQSSAAVVDACERAVMHAMHPGLDGDASERARDDVCNCGPSIVVLMPKELLATCDVALRHRFNECIATLRNIAAATAGKGVDAPDRGSELCPACHYAAHDASSQPPHGRPRTMAIEVHAHDWVSFVLQRRKEKLSEPLMLCE